jgi:hypothetical protein
MAPNKVNEEIASKNCLPRRIFSQNREVRSFEAVLRGRLQLFKLRPAGLEGCRTGVGQLLSLRRTDRIKTSGRGNGRPLAVRQRRKYLIVQAYVSPRESYLY